MPRPAFAKSPLKGRKKFIDDGRPITKKIVNQWYPFEVRKIKRGVNNPTKLRKGLVPGTVVILLTGPYRGRRVIYLKQLKQSGFLLVTGPFAINGVPLRRIAQKFVIITSTKIELGNVAGLDEIEDGYFKREKVIPDDDDDDSKVNVKPKTKYVVGDRKKTQLKIDNQIQSIIAETNLLKEYLAAYFTLVPGQPPHAIKF